MLLKIGSKGNEVKQLQEKLGLKPDGSFGPVTEKAVKSWQSSNGLKPDGVVGDETWSKMFGIVSTPITKTPLSNVVIPPSIFKLENLKGHVPDTVIAQIPETASKFNITNTLRLAHFLAQCCHESGGFKAVSENLNYSAKGLLGTFPKYFNSKTAAQYERKPEMIASKVYASRMGNGTEPTKEGYKFRGRGYIQLTGKSNYTALTKFIGEDCVNNPDLVATKYPLASAAFFFDSNKLWSICDKGSSRSVVEQVTKRVNGGLIGIEDRWKHFQEYYNLLS
jgi:putative chitinase